MTPEKKKHRVKRNRQRRTGRALWTTAYAALSILAALFAVLALRPSPDGVPVVVTKTDVPARAPITRQQVRVVPVPAEAVPDGALSRAGEAVGADPPLAIPAGTVVTRALLGRVSEAERVPQGFAHIALALESSAVFVAAGDRIEVWGTDPSCGSDHCPLDLLAGDVRVISVETAKASTFGGDERTLVTLMLQASNVGNVLQAAESGSIHFVLR